MRRTRRVEVIRYSHRTTVIHDEAGPASGPAADEADIDVLLGISDAIDSPAEVSDAAAPKADQKSSFLKRLLKSRAKRS